MITRNNRPHPNCQLGPIRVESGDSLEVLSEAVGMSPSCLLKLQDGRDPKLCMGLKIAGHYQKPLAVIWPDLVPLLENVPKRSK